MHTIYLDMDGVLADLYPLYKELTGHISGNFNQDDFNKVVFEHKIFEIVKPTYEFKFFKEYINRYSGVVNFAILGSLGSNSKSPERQKEIIQQKSFWLNKHGILFHNVPRYFVSNKKYKKNYACANTHLIDDTCINVVEFEEAGGNSHYHSSEIWENSFDYIDKVIEETQLKHYHFIY